MLAALKNLVLPMPIADHVPGPVSLLKGVAPFSVNLPPVAWYTEAAMQTKFSPDIMERELYEWELLFVWDELKKDHLKHSLLGTEAQYRFPAFTQKAFTAWSPKSPLESPIAMKAANIQLRPEIAGFPPALKIRGEVYLIRPQTWTVLDEYKQNTVQSRRHRVELIVPYRQVMLLKDHNLDPEFGVQDLFCRSEYTGSSVKHSDEKIHILRAWMYVGRPKYANEILNMFDFTPVNHFKANQRRWLPEYYHIRRPAHTPK